MGLHLGYFLESMGVVASMVLQQEWLGHLKPGRDGANEEQVRDRRSFSSPFGEMNAKEVLVLRSGEINSLC